MFTQKRCSNCEEFTPELNSFAKQNNDYEIVVIELETTLEELKEYQKEKKYNYIV